MVSLPRQSFGVAGAQGGSSRLHSHPTEVRGTRHTAQLSEQIERDTAVVERTLRSPNTDCWLVVTTTRLGGSCGHQCVARMMSSGRKDCDSSITLSERWSLGKKRQTLQGLSCTVLTEPTGFCVCLCFCHTGCIYTGKAYFI